MNYYYNNNDDQWTLYMFYCIYLQLYNNILYIIFFKTPVHSSDLNNIRTMLLNEESHRCVLNRYT